MTSSFGRRRRRRGRGSCIAPDAGQQREHRLDRVAHARADRRDVIGVDLGARLAARARGAPRRAARRAGPARADRARASGTAPRGRRVRATLRLARRRAGSCSTCAASWNVLHSSSRASRRSRSSKRSSSSSSSTSSRPGQQAPGLQLDERRRDEQELGRDVEVDALHALDLGAERVDDARRARSPRGRPLPSGSGAAGGRTGPRRPASRPRTASAVRLPARESQPMSVHAGRPAANARSGSSAGAGSVRRHGAGLLGHQAHRRDAPRQLPRARSAAGSTPSRRGLDRGPHHDAIFCVVDLHAMTVPYDPAELTARDPAPGDAAPRRRPRPRALAAVRAEPRARRTPSSPGS